MPEKPVIKGGKLKGKVVPEGRKYFLEYTGEDGKMEKQPLNSFIAEPMLKKFSGQSVEVVLSEPKPYPVAIGPEKGAAFDFRWILCYLPPPGVNKGALWNDVVSPEISSLSSVQIRLADKMLADGIISVETHDKVVASQRESGSAIQ